MKILRLMFCSAMMLMLCSCALWDRENTPAAPAPVAPETPAVKTADATADPAAKWRKLDLKKYPDANTILLDDIESVVYNPDGTYTRNDESWTLIVTEAGRKNSRTVTLHFNEFYQKVPQIYIEIIKADGKVVKPLLQKNITVESSQMQSNIYDPANKVISIGIPDLEIGDIIHTKWVMQTVKPRMKGVWCDIALLQTTSPILHYTYTISAPESAPLQKLMVKDEVADTLKKSEKRVNGRILYTFEVNNVPQVLTEPDMPPYYLYSMRILASTAKDWQTVSRWYYNLCEPRLKAVSPELKAYTQKLVAGKKGKAAIRALFDFVSKEIRYTGVTNEDSAPGYEPHDVKDTFAQKHGVCRDKAALLTTMLREAGFDAFMVLFMAGDPKDPEVPNNYFNHAITGVKMPDGELVLMDPTDENSSDLLPAYAMDKSFLCATEDGDTLQRTPVIPPEKNMLVIRSTGAIDEKFQLNLKTVLTFGGMNDNVYRSAFARWPEAYRMQFIASALKQALPGAEVVSVKILPEDIRDLSKAFTLIIECKVADYVNVQWGAGMLRMPFIGKGFGVLNFMIDDNMLKARRYPLQLDSTAGVDEKCEITLPANLATAALPEFKNVENSALTVKADISRQGRGLKAQRIIKLKKVEIPAKEYADFRKAVLQMSSSDKNSVVVKRSFADKNMRFAEAPAVLQDSQLVVAISKDGTMTVDCFQKIKVQNYSGVKDNSELMISYIPGISSAEFIAGSVTAPDGKSAKVDKNTIQVMDDDSSQAAPRYPVGKKIIVPFPGVKPGSVIELHWQKKFTGANAKDYIYALWRHMPVIKTSVVFKYPASMRKKIKLKLPAAGFRIEKDFSGKTHSVKVFAESVPMMPHEPGTPPAYLFAPYAGISCFDAAASGSEISNAIKKAAANAPESSELAQKLTAHIPDTAGKVRAIRDYVAKNIRSAGLEFDVLGVKYITNADVVLREGYGNSLDRAVLLYSMLKAVSINNIDIMLASNMPGISNVTEHFYELQRNIFDEVVLVVKSGEKEYYLNDNDEYSPLEYLRHDGRLGLNTVNGETIIFHSESLCSDRVRNDWTVKLLPGGSAEFTRTVSYYGGDFASFKRYFANITPEKERQFWEQQFSGVLAGAELLEKSRDFSLYPGLIKMRFIVPDFWRKSGDYASFTLPDSGTADLVRTAGKRTLPYWFMPKRAVQNYFAVEIPESWQSCELDGANYESEFVGVIGQVRQKTYFEDGLLEVVFFSGLSGTGYCDAHEYKLLEELQKKLSNPASRTFLFKTTGK